MGYLSTPGGVWEQEGLERFGRFVRAARRSAGISQMRLEELSGVDQTAVSRIELGRAPAMKLYKVVRLGLALGTEMPLGFCPHDHDCRWRTSDAPRPRSLDDRLRDLRR